MPLQEGLSAPSGPDPIVQWMQKTGSEVTRKNYLFVAYPKGVNEPMDPELEAEMPPGLQLDE